MTMLPRLSKQLKPFISGSLSVLAGANLLVLQLLLPASAQTGTPQPLEDFQTQNKTDPFSSRGNGQADGIFDLIHRAIQGPSRSLDEFNSEQKESLDTAAADFRAQQRQRIQNQQSPVPPSSPAAVPATSDGR
jgi:hypothetical protein